MCIGQRIKLIIFYLKNFHRIDLEFHIKEFTLQAFFIISSEIAGNMRIFWFQKFSLKSINVFLLKFVIFL